jgi:hypothetical protein
MPRPLTLAQLFRRQHAVVTRDQLRAAGVTASRVRAELNGERWQRINCRVICLHNGPMTRRQQLRAVLLSAPERSALCGFTVLEMRHIKGFKSPAVHVVIGKGDKVLRGPGVEVVGHVTRRFRAVEFGLLDNRRTTLPDRAFVEAATHSHDWLTAARVLVAGVQQARIPPALMREHLVAAPRARHRRLLLLLANDLEGGAHALSEVEFLAFCRRHGFPRPRLQARLDRFGRRRYLDAEFEAADGTRFWVEVDGGVHLNLSVRAEDDLKDNDATIQRRIVLRYASVLIYQDHPDAVRQIRESLRREKSDVESAIAR